MYVFEDGIFHTSDPHINQTDIILKLILTTNGTFILVAISGMIILSAHLCQASATHLNFEYMYIGI